MENENKDEEITLQMCDAEHIACKDCKWAILLGATCGSCTQYKNKPSDVYFDGQPCPKFKQK